MAYVELSGVSVGFGSGTARHEVLADLDLTVERGEFVAILGYSGCGKSTLMNLVAGLIEPDRGTVTVDGKPVKGPAPERGLVFQNYSLLPWLTVESNVAMAVDEAFSHESPGQRRERVEQAMAHVNLSDARHKRPGELSGGMRQRNSVARTLSMRPELLLLDEPLSALDALTRSVIQDQILEIREAEKQTVILITNDVDEGLYMADRIIPLSLGPVATFGPEVVVDRPHPRDRRALQSDTWYRERRQEVISFLLTEKDRELATTTSTSVSLPNVRPMDISRHRPGWFLGLRPKPRTELANS